jgi:RNA polymerase primary sigma factor
MRQFKISADSPTDRDDNINRYFNDVNSFEMLSAEEEFEIAKLAYDGCQESKERLVKANLKFVISVAKAYHNRGKLITLSDLINQGNVGLIEAVERFDPYKGFKLISYAVWHIRKEIIEFIASHSRHVSIPRYKSTILMKIGRIQAMFLSTYERMPTNDELIEELKKIDVKLKPKELNAISMCDAPISRLEGSKEEIDDFNPAPINVLSSTALTPRSLMNLDKEDFDIAFHKILKCLKHRERIIFCKANGLGGYKEKTNLNIIADELELSRETVRQILVKAVMKIQRKYGRNENRFLVKAMTI